MEETSKQDADDRSDWGPGPWDGEPDRIEWEHAGLPCLMLRGPTGAWCGYAAVAPGHPWHGIGYNKSVIDGKSMFDAETSVYRDHDSPESTIDVHGGLTYSAKCAGRICHVPKAGKSDDVWWFGFDCAHAGDMCPRSYRSIMRDAFEGGGVFGAHRETYRQVPYVQAETNKLAEQLAAVTR